MSWLTPLGFLGLTGLLVLLLIYIIKPNYQNKIVSSTFVWKLSLKYKKNKIPISKLRNILLLLCQILIITIAALMLAQPYLATEEEPVSNKKIFVIDASASMMAKQGVETRFDIALSEIETQIDETLKLENGEVSIILAHDSASYLIQQATAFSKGEVTEVLTNLREAAKKEEACTYGTPDIAGAMKLAEKITAFTPDVEVILYTDTNYIDAGNVTIKNVSEEHDYNVAILDTRMVLFDNRYTIEVDMVGYGKNFADINLYALVEGQQTTDDPDIDEADGVLDGLCDVGFVLETKVSLTDGEVTTVTIPGFTKSDFATEKDYNEAYKAECPELYETVSYKMVTAYIEEGDCFEADDRFTLTGGQKLPLKILYSSNNPNNYFSTAFRIIREKLQYRWDIHFEEFIVIPEMKDQEIPTEGYDIYIYERYMPETLPENGVTIISDPLYDIHGAGFKIGSEKYFKELTYFSKEEDHPIIKNLNPEEIGVTKYVEIMNPDGNYIPLLYCGTETMLYATDKYESDMDTNVVLMPFSLNYSNLPIIIDFPLMMYNILEYYKPSTITNYIYDVNESFDINCRGEYLEIKGEALDGEIITLTEFPNKLSFSKPGFYQIYTQDEIIPEEFYVKIPDSESNVRPEFDALENPQFMLVEEKEDTINTDILYYFAIALVALLFCEWWLHTREQY